MPAALLTLITLLASLVAYLVTPLAQAALYKCASEGGIVYQDAACPPGKELRNLDENPATLSVVPGTPVPAVRAAPGNRSRSSSARAASRASTRTQRSGNAAERRFIHTGMSEAEVVMRIGHPDVDSKGRGKSGRRWAYLPAAGDPDTMTTLTIAGGTVVEIERKVAR